MRLTSLFVTRSVRRLLSLSTALLVVPALLPVLPAAAAAAADPPAAWINEIHYDNVGTDAGEAIEVAGPAGTDLTGWTLVLYNGDTATAAVTYLTLPLTGPLPDQAAG